MLNLVGSPCFGVLGTLGVWNSPLAVFTSIFEKHIVRSAVSSVFLHVFTVYHPVPKIFERNSVCSVFIYFLYAYRSVFALTTQFIFKNMTVSPNASPRLSKDTTMSYWNMNAFEKLFLCKLS